MKNKKKRSMKLNKREKEEMRSTYGKNFVKRY